MTSFSCLKQLYVHEPKPQNVGDGTIDSANLRKLVYLQHEPKLNVNGHQHGLWVDGIAIGQSEDGMGEGVE